MREEYHRAMEVERKKEKQRWEESVRYQEELERQLTEKEQRKQESYEEFLKEKLMIDEIVRKIYEEDQRWERHEDKTYCTDLPIHFQYHFPSVIQMAGVEYILSSCTSTIIESTLTENELNTSLQ